MTTECTLHMLRRLQEHVRWQDWKIKELTEQRDAALAKAQELCHIATYTAEQSNRRGLVSIK